MRGFSLIELFVVVSIVALLISLLLPAIKKAKASGRSVVCLSNQRQLGFACMAYFDDTDTMPDWYVDDPNTYPFTNVHLTFFGVESWGYGFAVRTDLGSVWPYYQDQRAAYCPDWKVRLLRP